MGTGLPPTVDSTSIPGSSSSTWTVITSEDLSSQFPRTEDWENITSTEIFINNSLNSLSPVDYRSFTTDSFQEVRSTLENLINVLMPQGADSLIPFDADQEKLLSHIQSYFEHSPTWDSARMVEYWTYATVALPTIDDQRAKNFQNLTHLLFLAAPSKQKTDEVTDSLIKSYAYVLAARGVKVQDSIIQQNMLEQIESACQEEGKVTPETAAYALCNLVTAFRRRKIHDDNKERVQKLVERLSSDQIQAGLTSKDRGELITDFLRGMGLLTSEIPETWGLAKVELFSHQPIAAEKIGNVMEYLARLFRDSEVPDHRTRALNLLDRLAIQPLLPPEKKAIRNIFTLARNDDDIQPFRERLHNIIEKIKLLPLRGQAPDTLA